MSVTGGAGRSRTDAVGVISKLPRLGRTKTRLARGLGAEAALALHRAFLADELEELDAPGAWALWLVHDAPRDPFERAELADLLGDRARSLAPGAPDLPHELLEAFRALLREHDRVVIVSADVPHLRRATVESALAALDDADVVLGPGPDGGYSLVAMKAPHDVFTEVPMGNHAVERATVALARRLGLVVAHTEPLVDIDEAQDLLVLEGVPAAVAPRTRAAMASLQRGPVAVSLPRELQIEVTSRCNLRCTTCIRTHDQPEPDADLTLADFRAIVDGLPNLRRVAFQLNGEPLLARDLFPMIAEARARGAHTVLNTNGTLLDAVCRAELLACGLDELRVSLDGASAQTVQAMRGADVFARITSNVGELVRERGEAARPRIGLWQIATPRTLRELPALVRLAARLGVEEVYVQRLVLTGHGIARAEHSVHGRLAEDLRAVVAEAEAVAAATGVALRASARLPVAESLAPPPGDNPRLGCWRPWRSAVVTARGRVLPCCLSSFTTPYDELELGHLGEQGWEEIWNGARYQRVRRGILDGTPARSCRDCGERWSL